MPKKGIDKHAHLKLFLLSFVKKSSQGETGPSLNSAELLNKSKGVSNLLSADTVCSGIYILTPVETEYAETCVARAVIHTAMLH